MRTICFLLLIICLSCSRTNNPDGLAVFPGVDQIDHYRLQYTNIQLHIIFTTENISMDERKLAEILYHNEPTSVADSSLVSELETTPYFAKTTIANKRASAIVNAFAATGTLLASTIPAAPICAPTYRDILVFRKNKKICGFAKVCFECERAHLAGMQQSTDEDIQIDYKSLLRALHEGNPDENLARKPLPLPNLE